MNRYGHDRERVVKIINTLLGLVVSGRTEELLLRVEFLSLLGEGAGDTPSGHTAVAASAALDVVTLADVAPSRHLEEALAANESECGVRAARAVAHITTGWVSSAVVLEMLETRLVLAEDQAGAEPRNDEGAASAATVAETV